MPKKSGGQIALSVLRTMTSVVFRVIVSLLVVVVITGCILTAILSIYIMNTMQEDADILEIRDLQLNYTSIIYATDPTSNEPYELTRIHGSENRIWVDLQDIPKDIQQALIAMEDHRFEEHNGVDWYRTLAATVNFLGVGIYEGTPGGSTITQQLIKNITGEDDTNIQRKVQEIFRALNLEKKYSKDDILEAYLNTVHFGNNTNGVEAAAQLYFDKHAKDLTLNECASLVAIIKSPSVYEPRGKLESNIKRKNEVLKRMLEQERITQSQYNMAVQETLVISDKTIKKEVNSYFVDAVIEEVVQDLMKEKGWTRYYAEGQLFRGGLRIYTTVDENIQSSMEARYETEENVFMDKNIQYDPKTGDPYDPQPDSAAVVIDMNGAVKGIVGGLGVKTIDRGLNRATQSTRPPGSTMKPLGAYSQGIEYDLITWSTMIEDAPFEVMEGTETRLWPKNNSNTYTNAPMSVDEAVQRSINTVAARVGQMVTPQRSFAFLENVGISTLHPKEDLVLSSMSIGGMYNGVTVLEWAAAYQIFGNGGYYNKPHTYTKVVNYAGETILENTLEPKRVLSEETAAIMNKLLQRVVTGPYGTGKPAANGNMAGWEIAAKTGTSSDYKDIWFAGMTPEYVCVVWWGFDIPKAMRVNGQPARTMWNRIMDDIHKDLEKTHFPTSDKIQEHTYCTESGDIAGAYCPSTAKGWYKPSNIPSTCSVHYPGYNPDGWDNWGGDGNQGGGDESQGYWSW